MFEFDLIERLQSLICDRTVPHGSSCVLGIGDDAAVMQLPDERELVACTDSLVEGVHFPSGTAPAAVGHKALAVNLSDLAAMGAEPAWFLLSLTLPRGDREWLDAFARAMARLAAKSGIFLAGGDMTSGPLNICVTALGLIEKGQVLQRSGAKPGDLVVVSGRPGAAAHALQALQAGAAPHPADQKALDFPLPRIALGRALRGVATACIDLSDGLLADLGHILDASGVGAEIELHKLPCAESMAAVAPAQRWPLQLSGGDDYELCFTIAPALRGQLAGLAQSAEVELTVIGAISERSGLRIRQPDGGLYQPERAGYEHFRGPGGEDS